MASAVDERVDALQSSRTRHLTLQEMAAGDWEDELVADDKDSEMEDTSNSGVDKSAGAAVAFISSPEGREEGVKGAGSLLATSSFSSKSVHIIQEIIDTEKAYVNDLNDVIEGYETPCITTMMFDDDDEFACLFGNIDELHDFNSSLLQQLEAANGDPVTIGRCFIENEKNFHLYTLYCTNYPRSVATLASLTQSQKNEKVADFLKICQSVLGHALPLGSYLLKPVQRILKYRLLLMDLVKHVDLSSEGKAVLQQALATMTSVAEHINEMKKLHESTVRVQEIQSQLTDWKGDVLSKYGRLVLEDTFRVIGARDPRQVILFEKLLLVTKHREDGQYSYKTHFETGDMSLTESMGKDLTLFQVSQYHNSKNTITIHTRTSDIKQKWIATLRRLVIDSWPNLPAKARTIVLGLQEGKDAVPPPLKFSSSELPVLTTPIGAQVRRKLQKSRSSRRVHDRPQPTRVPRKHSMPVSLLEATLPGDIPASRFNDSYAFSPEDREMSRSSIEEDLDRPGDFCNPLFAIPDVDSETVSETAQEQKERVRVNEAEMMDPEDTPPRTKLRERARRVGKVDLQKLRQSRTSLLSREQSARRRTSSESQTSAIADDRPASGSNALTAEESHTVAAIGTLPRAPTSPFVRRPAIKKRANHSPIYRRRNSAVRRSSRKKKSVSTLLLSSSVERFGDKKDTLEARSSSVSTVAGDLAGQFRFSQESVNKDSDEEDSDSGWDITIVDAIFRKYTVDLGDQWRSIAEDSDHSTDSADKPFLSDLSPQKIEKSVAESSQLTLERPRTSSRSGHVTAGDKLTMSENGYKTFDGQQRASMDRSISCSSDDMSGGDENGLCAAVERDSDADRYVASGGRTEDVTAGTEDVDVEEGGHGEFVYGEALDSMIPEQTERVAGRRHGDVPLGQASDLKTEEPAIVSLSSVQTESPSEDSPIHSTEDLSLTDSPFQSKEVARKRPSTTELLFSSGEELEDSLHTGRHMHQREAGGLVADRAIDSASDTVSLRHELERSEEERCQQEESAYFHETQAVESKGAVGYAAEVAVDGAREKVVTFSGDQAEVSGFQSNDFTQNSVGVIPSTPTEMHPPADEDDDSDLPLEPENIFDVGDVDEAMASLCDILSPGAPHDTQEDTHVKDQEQSGHPAAMMSLEEALEMDQLPHSGGGTDKRKATSEFPLWLQRAPTVRRHDKRKSRSLNELQAEYARQESETGSDDKLGRSKSEPTQQRKSRSATTLAGEKDVEENKKGKVKALARNYSRMLKQKVRRTTSAQPETEASKNRGNSGRLGTRRAVSAQNSPGIGRRLAQYGMRLREEDGTGAEVTAASSASRDVDVTVRDVRDRLRHPSRRASYPVVCGEETSDSASIGSEASGGLVVNDVQDEKREKDAPPAKGWVKKLAAKFQAK